MRPDTVTRDPRYRRGVLVTNSPPVWDRDRSRRRRRAERNCRMIVGEWVKRMVPVVGA